jgi:hypothetical protein
LSSDLHRGPETWLARLAKFAGNEWPKAPLGASLGVLCAILKESFAGDPIFQEALRSKWASLARRSPFNGLVEYKFLLVAFLLALFLAVLPRILEFVLSILNSWFRGIISGLSFLWAVSFFVGFGFHPSSPFPAFFEAIIIALSLSTVSFICLVAAEGRIQEPVSLVVPVANTKRGQSDIYPSLDADTPIIDWSQDRLNRSPFVEALVKTVLESRAPVVAIQGIYGDGKSSVMNLLRNVLDRHSIVVAFSTWLPGSEKTLAADIFNDIATECRKRYYVPQLRRRLLTYANTLSGSVSFLRTLPAFLPTLSQRDEIEDLRHALARIPQRIVVLLDEMDRMQEEELRVLLKILRGVSNFPNLCYVCAFERSVIEKTLFGIEGLSSHEYCEKFFPVTFDLPKPDSTFLFDVLRTELEKNFNELRWLGQGDEEKKFSEDLRSLWDDTLIKVCTNLRKVGLVLNDVRYAARPIAREVNAFDLVVLEALRRFFPDIYEWVWRHQEYFIDAPSDSWRSILSSDDAIKRERSEFFGKLKVALDNTGRPEAAASLLSWLFPTYAKFANEKEYRRRRLSDDADKGDIEKRVWRPDFFPIYFRYQVPETMFGALELEEFVNKMNSAKKIDDCARLFQIELSRTPRNSPRRHSFLHRLGQSIDLFNDLQAEALAFAIAENAHEYVYDVFLLTFAEAGRALVIVLQIAERFSKTEKIQQILEGTIQHSTEDTFALRIFLPSTTQRERNKIILDFSHVDSDKLEEVFVERMERRYGPAADVEKIQLAQGDRIAFVIWSDHSEQSRDVEVQFWQRFIGTSRRRLAIAADFLFPRGILWDVNPSPFIDKLFPLDQFESLLKQLPKDGNLTERESKALVWIQKLIDGEFANGIKSPDDWI